MAPLQQRSPDGFLTLVVSHDEEGVTIGFQGQAWHTHGDILAASYPFGKTQGLAAGTAAKCFVDDVLANRVVIVVQRICGQVRDIWVTSDIDGELRYKAQDETLEFRYWDGRAARPSAG